MIERLKALWAKLVARFQKKPEAAIPSRTEEPLSVVVPKPPKPSERAAYEAWRNGQPATTRAYIPTWEQHLQQRPATARAADLTGFDLGEGNALPKVNQVTAGVPLGPYRVEVKAGAQRPRVTFMGAPGAFFGKLSYELKNEAGQVIQSSPSVSGAIVKNVPLDGLHGVHYLTVTVDGSGPLGAQFQQ